MTQLSAPLYKLHSTVCEGVCVCVPVRACACVSVCKRVDCARLCARVTSRFSTHLRTAEYHSADSAWAEDDEDFALAMSASMAPEAAGYGGMASAAPGSRSATSATSVAGMRTGATSGSVARDSSSRVDGGVVCVDEGAEGEEEQLRRAIQMSMQSQSRGS